MPNGYPFYPYQPPSRIPAILGGLVLVGGIAGLIWYLTKQGIIKCNEGETKCIGNDLYKCIDGKWQLVEKNSSQCIEEETPSQACKNFVTTPLEIEGFQACDILGNLCEYRNGRWICIKSNAYECQTGETHKKCFKIQENSKWKNVCLDQPGAGVDECPGTVVGCPCYNDDECKIQPGAMFTCYEGICQPECLKELHQYFAKSQYNASFEFEEPCVGNKIMGTIHVKMDMPSFWRNIDIWAHSPDGSKKLIKKLGFGTPIWWQGETDVPVNENFKTMLISKISVWGGGGPPFAKANRPALKDVYLTLRKF